MPQLLCERSLDLTICFGSSDDNLSHSYDELWNLRNSPQNRDQIRWSKSHEQAYHQSRAFIQLAQFSHSKTQYLNEQKGANPPSKPLPMDTVHHHLQYNTQAGRRNAKLCTTSFKHIQSFSCHCLYLHLDFFCASGVASQNCF